VIEPLFKPFSRIPDPAGYQPVIDGLSAAMHDLSGGHIDQDPIDKNPYLANPTLEKIHTASDYLQDWSGQAAMLFKQKFLDPFPAISANQFILTAILKAALEAHQAMWAKTRDDIDKIAHATMDAFDNKCCDKNTWNVTFTVLSSIGATAAPFSRSRLTALRPLSCCRWSVRPRRSERLCHRTACRTRPRGAVRPHCRSSTR
jgi:hypothetical protein